MAYMHECTYRSKILEPYLVLAKTIAIDNLHLKQMAKMRHLLKPILLLCPFPPTVDCFIDKEDYFIKCIGFPLPQNYEENIKTLTARESAKLLHLIIKKGIKLPPETSDPIAWAQEAKEVTGPRRMLDSILDRIEVFLT